MEAIYSYNRGLGFDPFTLIGAGGGIISSIFGKKESPDQEFARWMEGWQSDFPAENWKWFTNWIGAREQTGTWDKACPALKSWTGPIDSRQTGWKLKAQIMTNDIGKKEKGRDGSPVPHCRADWRTWSPNSPLMPEISNEPGVPSLPGVNIPGVTPEPVKAGFSGLPLVLLVGAALFLVLGRGK